VRAITVDWEECMGMGMGMARACYGVMGVIGAMGRNRPERLVLERLAWRGKVFLPFILPLS